MALKTLKTSGKWQTNSNWTPEAKPTATDEVLIPAGKEAKIEAEANCRALINEGTVVGSSTLNIGDATAPTEATFKEIALKSTAGSTWSHTGKAVFKGSSATILGIFMGGKKFGADVVFETTGKWLLEEELKATTEVTMNAAGELKTNGQKVEAKIVKCTSTAKLDITNSTIKCTNNEATAAWSMGESVVLTTTGSTIEITNTGTTEKTFNGGSKTYATNTITGDVVKVEDSNTITTYNVNTKRVSKTCKATCTALSNHLVVTGEEASLSNNVEIVDPAFPIGTTIVKKIEVGLWETSANATETVAIARSMTIFPVGLIDKQGTTQTVTTFGCNGTEAEPARLTTNEAGKAATIKLPATKELTAYLRVKDHTISGGTLYLPHGTDLGGNTGIKFEAEPAGAVFGKATGTLLLTGTAVGTLRSMISGKATGSILLVGTSTGIARNVVIGKATGSLLFTGASAGVIWAVVSGKASGSLLLTGTSTGTVQSLVSGKATGTLLLVGESKASIANNVTGKATGVLFLTGTGKAFKPSGGSTKRTLILLFEE